MLSCAHATHGLERRRSSVTASIVSSPSGSGFSKGATPLSEPLDNELLRDYGRGTKACVVRYEGRCDQFAGPGVALRVWQELGELRSSGHRSARAGSGTLPAQARRRGTVREA